MPPESDIHARVLAQYTGAGAAAFYRRVMGDGGAAIHYGHYQTHETPMREAVRASTLALLDMARRHDGGRPGRVIDLGAGAGGPARLVAEQTGALITCVDLCEYHNAVNRRDARAAGLDERIRTWTGSFDALPVEWNSGYDLAWGQDAFCHAPDRKVLFKGIHRVVRPGGLLVFSDILRDDNAAAADVAAFTGVNAVDHLASASETIAALGAAGLVLLQTQDWSHHLNANFTAMLKQIRHHRADLLAEGVPAARIDNFALSLERRLRATAGHVMCWAAFACRRLESDKAGDG